MKATEATALLRTVKAFCPSQQIDQHTPEAWALALDDIRYKDAQEALIVMAKRDLEPGQSRYIEPGHIRREVRRLREHRLDNAPTYEPPPGLNTSEHLDWLREARQAIADGDVPRRAGNLIAGKLDLPELKSVDDVA